MMVSTLAQRLSPAGIDVHFPRSSSIGTGLHFLRYLTALESVYTHPEFLYTVSESDSIGLVYTNSDSGLTGASLHFRRPWSHQLV